MLYNSDGLPVILWYIKKCIFLNVIVGTFYQYLPYFQNKNENRKNMQYENNLRKKCFTERKKKDLFFKKPFSKRYIWKKGGRLIIRVVLYPDQYGTII